MRFYLSPLFLAATLTLSAHPVLAARFTPAAAVPVVQATPLGQTITLHLQNDGSLGLTAPAGGYGLEITALDPLPTGLTLVGAMPSLTAPQSSIQVVFANNAYGDLSINYDYREKPYQAEYTALWTGFKSGTYPITNVAAGTTDADWVASAPENGGAPVALVTGTSFIGPALVADTSVCTSGSWLSAPFNDGLRLTSPGSPEVNKCLHTPNHWPSVITSIKFTRALPVTVPTMFNWTYKFIADDVLSINLLGSALPSSAVTSVPLTIVGDTFTLDSTHLTQLAPPYSIEATVLDTGMSVSYFQIAGIKDESPSDSVDIRSDRCPDTPAGYVGIDTTPGAEGCGIFKSSLSNAGGKGIRFFAASPAAIPATSTTALGLLTASVLFAGAWQRRRNRKAASRI